jgi:MoxR-like ATPase
LGRAFTSPERVVLLIDEIDKADLEFPNDLLNELDEMSFYIPEIDETITACHRPITIITSNAEKELPDAFLRRCIFHYIEFPSTELMEEIVRVHFPDIKNNLMHKAIAAFYKLRDIDGFRKKPSTSELLDWIQALVAGGISPDRIQNEIPFIGTLLKKETDYDHFMTRIAR